jgi:hypothetical protein
LPRASQRKNLSNQPKVTDFANLRREVAGEGRPQAPDEIRIPTGNFATIPGDRARFLGTTTWSLPAARAQRANENPVGTLAGMPGFLALRA